MRGTANTAWVAIWRSCWGYLHMSPSSCIRRSPYEQDLSSTTGLLITTRAMAHQQLQGEIPMNYICLRIPSGLWGSISVTNMDLLVSNGGVINGMCHPICTGLDHGSTVYWSLQSNATLVALRKLCTIVHITLST